MAATLVALVLFLGMPMVAHAATLSLDGYPVDLRPLFPEDRPAGARGKVRVDGDRLVWADGQPARFWGTNVAADALLASDRTLVRRHAERLAAFGFNLVRLHHHDSAWVRPNVFNPAARSTRSLLPASLESIDWWVKCLQDQGIHVWLDLHVGRRLVPGDGVPGVEELGESGDLRGFSFVNRDIERRMQEFAAAYLDRRNAFTGRRYADDAGVLAVLVTNENDLGAHFASRMFRERRAPVHQGLFHRAVEEAAGRLGLSGVDPGETWAPGPGRVVLAELEAAFFGRAMRHLRALGLGALIAVGSQWGQAGWNLLPPLARGDVIDAHAYGTPDLLATDPRRAAHHLAWLAGAQVAGKPLTVSEWNLDMDLPRSAIRFTFPMLTAAVGALQGWDALMHYNYQQAALEPKPRSPHRWSSAYDPALMALMPAAAVAFRKGHLRQAVRTYHVALTPQALYHRDLGAGKSLAVRTLVEQSRVAIALPDTPALDWDTPARVAGGARVTGWHDDHLPAGAVQVVSDTGELRRDWAGGWHTIDAPATRAAVGRIGGREVRLGEVTIRITSPATAAVVLTSLDGRPVGTSERILLTVVADARLGPGDTLPFAAVPVRGTVTLGGRARLRLRTLDPDGTGGPVTPLAGDGSGVTVVLPAHAAHWFMLSP